MPKKKGIIYNPSQNHGVYHHMSEKHLDRYVTEFEGRHNRRPLDAADQMSRMAKGADGKRLRYQDLVAA